MQEAGPIRAPEGDPPPATTPEPRSIRAPAGDLPPTGWLAARSYRGERYAAEALLERKVGTVSVVLPARAVAETIGPVIEALAPLERTGLIDELVVVDAASEDGTPEVAEVRGATVLQESELVPRFGAARGKGDAMWRGLASTSGDIVAFLDTDTGDFLPVFLLGLLGPLLDDPSLQLVKGSFQRPLRMGGEVKLDEGGRVTELMARPLINLYVPELAGFHQPLAGEVAARRPLLERLSFPVGYGVEIGMLIDVTDRFGLDAIAQVDLERRVHRNRNLADLSRMSFAVLQTAMRRLASSGRVDLRTRLDLGLYLFDAVDGAYRMEPSLVEVRERPPAISVAGDGAALA